MTSGFPRRAFSKQDWSEIEEMLAHADQVEPAAATFELSLERLESWLTCDYLAAPTAVNWLLDLWEAARSVGPDALAPLERCLSGIAHRDLVYRDELESLIRELRSASRFGSHPIQP